MKTKRVVMDVGFFILGCDVYIYGVLWRWNNLRCV